MPEENVPWEVFSQPQWWWDVLKRWFGFWSSSHVLLLSGQLWHLQTHSPVQHRRMRPRGRVCCSSQVHFNLYFINQSGKWSQMTFLMVLQIRCKGLGEIQVGLLTRSLKHQTRDELPSKAFFDVRCESSLSSGTQEGGRALRAGAPWATWVQICLYIWCLRSKSPHTIYDAPLWSNSETWYDLYWLIMFLLSDHDVAVLKQKSSVQFCSINSNLWAGSSCRCSHVILFPSTLVSWGVTQCCSLFPQQQIMPHLPQWLDGP